MVGGQDSAEDAEPVQLLRSDGCQCGGGTMTADDGQEIGEVDVGPLEAEQVARRLGHLQRRLFAARCRRRRRRDAPWRPRGPSVPAPPPRAHPPRAPPRAPPAPAASASLNRQSVTSSPANADSAKARSWDAGCSRDQRHRLLDGGQGGRVLAGLAQVLAQPDVQERQLIRRVARGERDGAPGELDRPRGGADVAGESGGPRADLRQLEPGDFVRSRDPVPQCAGSVRGVRAPRQARTSAPPAVRPRPTRVARRPDGRRRSSVGPAPPARRRDDSAK